MKWRALPIIHGARRYIRVKRSYIRKWRVWNAAKRKIRGSRAP
nr:MAG TPA: hypothetical protein [Caudoviricetes sp.]